MQKKAFWSLIGCNIVCLRLETLGMRHVRYEGFSAVQAALQSEG